MCSMCITHLVSAAVGLLFLNVHGQHLATEREALGFLNHLLVGRYGVVPHDNMALNMDHIGQDNHKNVNRPVS